MESEAKEEEFYLKALVNKATKRFEEVGDGVLGPGVRRRAGCGARRMSGCLCAATARIRNIP